MLFLECLLTLLFLSDHAKNGIGEYFSPGLSPVVELTFVTSEPNSLMPFELRYCFLAFFSPFQLATASFSHVLLGGKVSKSTAFVRAVCSCLAMLLLPFDWFVHVCQTFFVKLSKSLLSVDFCLLLHHPQTYARVWMI